MSDPNLNALWARLIAEELFRAHVGYVVLCPGSRNSPLLFALHKQFGDRCRFHIDERGAGFIALGLIKATGNAVAICVTSGSAVANLMPAIVEADAAQLPLHVISADRPWELQNCGAPQTMEQRSIFSAFVRASLNLGDATDREETLLALRSHISRTAQINDGPTHINVPLRDPLPPLPDERWVMPALSTAAMLGRDKGQPFTHLEHIRQSSEIPPLDWLRPGMRGLIIAGCQDHKQPLSGIKALISQTGFPVIADAASGLRSEHIPNLICAADALVSGELAKQHAEVIIQIGNLPLARPVYTWLSQHTCPWIIIEDNKNRDASALARLSISSPSADILSALGSACSPGNRSWAKRWNDAEQYAQLQLQNFINQTNWNEDGAACVAVRHAGFGFIHLASSMSVRYGNLFCSPSSRPVFSNRGVNGIDGTIATFLGELDGLKKPGLLLIGDLALQHDMGSLLAQLPFRHGAIVVLNNFGGGIFDFLPVHSVPHYQTIVRTNHQRDCRGIALSGSIPYHAANSVSTLTQALDAALGDTGLHLIECQFPGSDPVHEHRSLINKLIAPDS